MLRDLQNYLSGIYRADPGCAITDYLVTDPTLAGILGRGTLVPNCEESVLVSESGGSLDLCLYLDQQLLDRLDGENPLEQLNAPRLKDVWTVLEGVSHFNYLVWNARQDRKVTLMELEMQAEVDKFISTWLLAQAQQECDFAHLLHRWLFDDISFNPALDDAQRQRYATANHYAGRYCHGLLKRMPDGNPHCLEELRHFYRLSQAGKISLIHDRAYTSAG
ncbi:MAG: hypothetical protein L0Y45_05195 [Woeseiaceae bacterium]|nr:hypothetical protein [Woeseiaceae bacterium]